MCCFVPGGSFLDTTAKRVVELDQNWSWRACVAKTRTFGTLCLNVPEPPGRRLPGNKPE